jgi:hypothetical protein
MMNADNYQNESNTVGVCVPDKGKTVIYMSLLSKTICFFFSAIACLFLLYLLKFFNYGFDFTDEGFYLLQMQRPDEYPGFHTLAGFIYNPLYILTNGNIAYLRIINFLIIIALAFNLCKILLQTIFQKIIIISQLFIYLTSFQLALCSSTVLLLWLPTPNYNLLNYIAIIIIATGVLILLKNTNTTKNKISTGWLVIGIGGYLSFMAKAQTSAFLGLIVFIWAFISKNFNVKGILSAFCIALGLILLSSLWTDGSIYGIFLRLFEASQLESMTGTHQVWKFITFKFPIFFKLFSINFVLVFLSLFLLGFFLALFQNNNTAQASIIIISIYFLLSFIFNYLNLQWHNLLGGFIILAPILGYTLFILWNEKRLNYTPNYPLVIFFILLTISYGIGSNNSFFITMSISVFFIFLALLIFLFGVSNPKYVSHRLISLSAICLCITIGLIVSSLGKPYRQPSILWLYSSKYSVREGDAPMYFSPLTTTYLRNLHNIAQKSDLKPDTPIIDLSGRSPGTIYALNGFTPKTPWIWSGFPGSNKFLFIALNKFTCEQIATSWILFETNTGYKTLDPTYLKAFGINFPNDYKIAGVNLIPINFSKSYFKFSYQYVFKPHRTKEDAIFACVKSKTQLGLI